MNYNMSHLDYMNYLAEKKLIQESVGCSDYVVTEADNNDLNAPKVSPITKYLVTVTTNIQNTWNKFKQAFEKMIGDATFKVADKYIESMSDQQKNSTFIQFKNKTELPDFKAVYDFIDQVKIPNQFDINDQSFSSVNDYISSHFNSVNALNGWNKTDNLDDYIMSKTFVTIEVQDPNKPKSLGYTKPIEGFENNTPAIQQQMTFIKDFDKNVQSNLRNDIDAINALNKAITNSVNTVNTQAVQQQQQNNTTSTENNNQTSTTTTTNNNSNNTNNNNNSSEGIKPTNASYYFDSPYLRIFSEADDNNNQNNQNQNNNSNSNPQKEMRDHVVTCMKACTQMLKEEFVVTNHARMICYRNVMNFARAGKANANGKGSTPVKVEAPPDIKA